MLSQRFASLQPVGILVMRVVLGGILLAHGYAKLFGGMEKFTSPVIALGLPRWTAPVAAWAEFLAGVLLVIGLFSRLAAFVGLVHMLVGIWAHRKEGFFYGWDFPLALVAMSLALLFFGAGPWSIDNKSRPASGRRR
jgi:putative oxidoreductase